MLSIVLGRAGRLWAEVTGLAQRALWENRGFYLIVPEQYTLKAERDLMEDLGVPGLLTLSVLSPSRLQKLVFERAGSPRATLLDARGKRVAVARALHKRQASLQYYKRAAERTGFIASVSDLISVFRQEGMMGGAVAGMAQAVPDRVLQMKLSDLAAVMEGYEEGLGDTLTDSERMHRDMLARLPSAGVLDGAYAALYGFDVLTPPLRELALAALPLCSRVLVALVGDAPSARDGHAFEPVVKSARRLLKQAEAAGEKADMAYLPAAPLNAPAGIRHLEQYFLGFARPPLEGPPEGVRLFSAPSPYAEAEFVCQTVLQYMAKGVAPEEMLVMAGGMGRYGTLLKARLGAYRIPCYVSAKSAVASHQVVRLPVSALRCLSGSWQTEDVEDMLSTGLTGLSEQEGWQLSRYAAAHGIRGKMWLKPFTRGSESVCAAAEALRLRLVPPVEALHERLKSAEDSGQAVRAVMAYLDELDVYGAAAAMEEELENSGLPEPAQWTRQVWTKLCETLEQIHLVLRGERIPLSRFAAWLEAALEDIEVSALPPTQGCVQVGEIGRVAMGRPRVAFLMGLNDGFLAAGEDALLNDEDMRMAEEASGLSVRLSGAEREKLRLLDLWKAMAAPTEALFLSYALSDDAGGPERPLSRLTAVRQLLPMLAEEGGAFFTGEAAGPLAPLPALEHLAPMVRAGQMAPQWREAWSWLQAQEEWKGRARALENALDDAPAEKLTPMEAGALFNLGSMSVTRLETYAACPYQFFVRYGLRPEEKTEWRVRANDAGVFYHTAIELFSKAAMAHPVWPDISREQCDGMLETAIAPLVAEWARLPFGDTPRARAVSGALIDTCKRAAWQMTAGFQSSGFRLKALEMAFGQADGHRAIELALKDGRRVLLHGKIDRMDACEKDGKTYLRIVDYKSGAVEFSPSDVYAGTQLQLLLYLKAALRVHKGAEAAGLFYQRVANPMLSADDRERTDEELEKDIAGELKLNGLALKDFGVYKLMERTEPPVYIEALFKQDGTPKANKALATREELDALMDFAGEKAGDMAERMREGYIEARPLTEKAFSPCQHCDYQGICRRDPLLKQKVRRRENITLEELIGRTAQTKP